MYSKDELLLRIKNGENPEVIANEFAALLNNVIDLDREQRAAEAEAQKVAEREAQLDSIAQTILEKTMEYVRVAAPHLAAEFEAEGTDVAFIRDNLDTAIKTVEASMALLNQLKLTPKPASEVKDTPDDIINRFLKNFVD